jgi:hypothetical protein
VGHTQEVKVNRVIQFTLALALCLGLVFACERDEPVAPGVAELPKGAVAIDAHGSYMLPLGTQTLWSCASDSAFDYALASWTDGDVCNLTSDDTLYTVNETDTTFKGYFSGTDDGRSHLDTQHSQFWPIYFEDSHFDNIYFNDIINIGDNSDSTSFNNCRMNPASANYLALGGNIRLNESEFRRILSGQEVDNVYIYEHDFIDYGGLCLTEAWQAWKAGYSTKDIQPTHDTDNGTAYLHSWQYDNKVCSFDFDFNGSAAYWIAGDSLVVVGSVSTAYGWGVLKYGDDDCSEYSVAMDGVHQNGNTVFYKKVDIGFATGNDVWWEIQASICGETVETTCYQKTRPKTPDSDPPIPQEQ